MNKIILNDENLSIIKKKCSKKYDEVKKCLNKELDLSLINECEKEFYHLGNCVYNLK